MKTIAIDFETANEERGSPCSIGLAWIEQGEIVRTEERLIRPRDMRFSGFNIAIHGIRPQDVEHAPEFPEVLDEFKQDFQGATLIAHNAAFDMSVLRATLDKYGRRYPACDYLCTLKMSQVIWQDSASHRLSDIAALIGFNFRHHNAAEDARACAAVALAVADAVGVKKIEDIASLVGMTPGRIFSTGYEPCSSQGYRKRSHASS